ncbi:SMI1/KNR4 family protein [Chryseobacterium sp. DT-3]|uniref:SMI1/KNR4 family protein n=1 Tax=Chryseobacterium sp. DT-3 TaxID=3396164 RepID=UPI003F1D8647
MEKFNFRFVNDSKNQNVGLTIEEIDMLKDNVGVRFPKAYIDYLLKAGKNSNVFNVETNSNEFQRIQKGLRAELDALNLLQNEEILCIKKELGTYYFFNLSENNQKPTLYIFDEDGVEVYWGAFQKTIIKAEGGNFITFINRQAERIYGTTVKQYLKNIPLYIIAIPISIIFLMIAGTVIVIKKFRVKINKQ